MNQSVQQSMRNVKQKCHGCVCVCGFCMRVYKCMFIYLLLIGGRKKSFLTDFFIGM